MDLIVILLLVLLVYRMKFSDGICLTEAMTVENTIPLRGIFALVILLNHISTYTKDTGGMIFNYFSLTGALSVSVFFTLSGFGLMTSYMKKGDEYLKHFPLKRFSALLIPYFIATVIYHYTYKVLNIPVSDTLFEAFVSIFKCKPIVTYSWYVIAITLFYAFFYISTVIFRKKYCMVLCGIFAFLCIYTITFGFLGFTSGWYVSCFAFAAGIALALYIDKLEMLLKKNYILILCIVIVLFILFSFVYSLLTNKYFKLIPSMIKCVVFAVLIVLASCKLRFENPVLNFLGQISYEFYIYQGLAFVLLISMPKNLLYASGVILITLACAFISNKIDILAVSKFNTIAYTKK